jgi:hypothetical protein
VTRNAFGHFVVKSLSGRKENPARAAGGFGQGKRPLTFPRSGAA